MTAGISDDNDRIIFRLISMMTIQQISIILVNEVFSVRPVSCFDSWQSVTHLEL